MRDGIQAQWDVCAACGIDIWFDLGPYRKRGDRLSGVWYTASYETACPQSIVGMHETADRLTEYRKLRFPVGYPGPRHRRRPAPESGLPAEITPREINGRD